MAPNVAENFNRGIKFLEPAIGNAPYWFWPPSMDTVPAGPGAYAANWEVNQQTLKQIINQGIFCQGVGNIIRRVNRKIVPTRGNAWYDGGTLANQDYFGRFIERFDRWAKYPRGTMLGRYFTWDRVDRGDQGHVMYVLDGGVINPRILHSHPAIGGLDITRMGDTHAGWYIEYAIRPQFWINHDAGGF